MRILLSFLLSNPYHTNVGYLISNPELTVTEMVIKIAQNLAKLGSILTKLKQSGIGGSMLSYFQYALMNREVTTKEDIP